MNPDRWHQVKEIFNSALELKPNEREEHLKAACAGDDALYSEVEKLLASYRSEFMEERLAADQRNERGRYPQGSTLGRYEIVDLVGEGGMGEVYLAKDKELGRKVAIKVLNSKYEKTESNTRRFVQEAKAASALNHPNILTIHEIGQTGDSHYIVSEYIDGQTLRSAINAGRLPLSKILDITIQVANALAAAHAAHIIHRDIKPENIIVRRDGYVKVVDFGLAKLLPSPIGLEDETVEQNQTSKGLILGTVSYMSPEQARAAKVDERTDIFSLGVVLYEMVAGRTPFAGDSTSDALANLISRDPDPLSRFAQNVPDELQRIVSKMLRKDPDERYQTMKGLVADLKELEQRITIESKASPSSPLATEKPTDIFWKTTGGGAAATGESVSARRTRYRHPAAVAGIAALLLAALSSAWYWRSTADPSQPQIKSLAVLPLRSLDAGENYLGLGIADAVIRRISQTGAIIVRPTSAVRKYLDEETDALAAAKQLTADAVLEGSVQRANDRLRVSVNLLRTSDGASLWADSFDMRAVDIFAIQDTVAQKVTATLKLKLEPSERSRLTKQYTSDPEAYEYYIKGRASLERRTTSIGDLQFVDAAIEYFQKAIATDPKYALAYAEQAYALMWIANFNDPDNPIWVERMRHALEKAEDLDPQLAEIHRARFEYYFSKYGNWDLAQAMREAKRAIALNPAIGHSELGTMHDHIGIEELVGLAELQRELEIDPTNIYHQNRLVEAYRLYGRFDESIETNQRFFGSPSAAALVEKGRLAEAESLLESSIKRDPGNIVSKSWLALAWALKGEQTRAQAAVPDLLRNARNNRSYHHVTYNVAAIYALAGNADEAVKWLRITAETGMPNYPMMVRDPHLNRIRDNAGFVQFLQDLKVKWEVYRREFS